MSIHSASGYPEEAPKKHDFTRITPAEYWSLDFYARLGLSSDCSSDQIKKAYRKLAMTFHPDRWDTTGRTTAEKKELFQHLGEAYGTLNTEEKRQTYNASYRSHQGATQRTTWRATTWTHGSTNANDSYTQPWFKSPEQARYENEWKAEMARQEAENKARSERFKKYHQILDSLDQDIKNGKKPKSIKEYYRQHGINEEVLDLSDFVSLLEAEWAQVGLEKLSLMNFIEKEEAVYALIHNAISHWEPEIAEICITWLSWKERKKAICYRLSAIMEQWAQIDDSEFQRHLDMSIEWNNIYELVNELVYIAWILLYRWESKKLELIIEKVKVDIFFGKKIIGHVLRMSAYIEKPEQFMDLYTRFQSESWFHSILEECLPYLHAKLGLEKIIQFLRTLESGYRISDLIRSLEESNSTLMNGVKERFNAICDILDGKTETQFFNIWFAQRILSRYFYAWRNTDVGLMKSILSERDKQIWIPDELKKYLQFLTTVPGRSKKAEKTTTPNQDFEDISDNEYISKLRKIILNTDNMSDEVLMDFVQHRFSLANHPELMTNQAKLDYIWKISEQLQIVWQETGANIMPRSEDASTTAGVVEGIDKKVDDIYSISRLGLETFMITAKGGPIRVIWRNLIQEGNWNILSGKMFDKNTSTSIVVDGFIPDELIIIRADATPPQINIEEINTPLDIAYQSTPEEIKEYEKFNADVMASGRALLQELIQGFINGTVDKDKLIYAFVYEFSTKNRYKDKTSRCFWWRNCMFAYLDLLTALKPLKNTPEYGYITSEIERRTWEDLRLSLIIARERC